MNVGILRNSFWGRAPLLKLSLEWQEKCDGHEQFKTHVYVDPHNFWGFTKKEFNLVTKDYKVFPARQNRRSWTVATQELFSSYPYEYILSIEDDVILSKDYFKLCLKLIESEEFHRDDVLYFHPGGWMSPKGDKNLIITSGISSRSILIQREKFFKYVWPAFLRNSKIKTSDMFLGEIKERNELKVLTPQYNRHGHFGVWGFSANAIFDFSQGRRQIFPGMDFYKIYEILKDSCLSGEKLRRLNQGRNPRYFWDFDPNVMFDASKKITFEI